MSRLGDVSTQNRCIRATRHILDTYTHATGMAPQETGTHSLAALRVKMIRLPLCAFAALNVTIGSHAVRLTLIAACHLATALLAITTHRKITNGC